MLYDNKQQSNENENSARVERLQYDFLRCFRGYAPLQKAFVYAVTAAYVFHKAYAADRSQRYYYQDVLAGKVPLTEGVLNIVKEIPEKLWNVLEDHTGQYVPEDYAPAVLSYENVLSIRSNVEYTSDSVVRLAKAVLNITTADEVADFFCGTGSFLISTSTTTDEKAAIGYELNPDLRQIALMKADLLDARFEVKLANIYDFIGKEATSKKFTKIFANPPFRADLATLDKNDAFWDRFIRSNIKIDRAPAEWVANAIICDMLADNGKAAVVVTNGSIWNRLESGWRKFFLENGLIEAVISMPERMLNYTGIGTSLLILSKGNKSVRLVDATNICQKGRRLNEFSEEDITAIVKGLQEDVDYSLDISLDELKENDYALNTSRYLTQHITFENGVPFERVLNSIRRGAAIFGRKLDEITTEDNTGLKYLQLANIKDGIIEENLSNITQIDKTQEKYCLKNNNVIISKTGAPYKVAVAKVKEGEKILVNGNLFILDLDETQIDPYYLQAFLESEKGSTILKNITVGDMLPILGVDALKKINIPLPSMEEQQRISKKYQKLQMEITLLKQQLENATDKLSRVFDEESDAGKYGN